MNDRVLSQEFETFWNQNASIYDLTVTTVNEWGGYTWLVFDVVLERDNKYQWVQFKTIWDEGELLDIQLQPISYYERVKGSSLSKDEEIAFVNKVVNNLNKVDTKDFGWRYQQQNPMIDQAVKSVEVLDSQLLAANDHGESLIKLKYMISLIEHSQVVEALFYVKSYGSKHQVEDIQIIEVNKIGDKQ